MADLDTDLLDKRMLAELLHTSIRNLDRLIADRRLPAPMWLGFRPRWQRAGIIGWIRAGMPVRATWEAIDPGKSCGRTARG